MVLYTVCVNHFVEYVVSSTGRFRLVLSCRPTHVSTYETRGRAPDVQLVGAVSPPRARRKIICPQASRNMLKIAPATVLALSAAFCAFTALSHHVQVEVFVI